jgi:hypothetical protein
MDDKDLYIDDMLKLLDRPAPKDGYQSLSDEEIADIVLIIRGLVMERDAVCSLKKSDEKLVSDLKERIKWLELEKIDLEGQLADKSKKEY